MRRAAQHSLSHSLPPSFFSRQSSQRPNSAPSSAPRSPLLFRAAPLRSILRASQSVQIAFPVRHLSFSRRADSRHRTLENAQFSALMQRGFGAASALRMFQLRRQGGFQPDAGSYTALITSLMEAGRPDQGLQLFEELVSSGEAMTLAAYNAGMQLYTKKNQLDRVLNLFEKLRGAQLRPSEATFSTLIEASCRAFQFQRAQEFFAEMKTYGLQPDASAYNLILSHAVKTKKLDFAMDFYSQMQADGITPSRDTLQMMIEVYSRRNDLEKAVALCELLFTEKLAPSPQALTQLIAACGRQNRVDVALDVFESMKKNLDPVPPPEIAYAELISLLASRDQLIIARDYLNEMLAIGYAPMRSIFHSLINGYARNTQADGIAEAEGLFDQMNGLKLTPNEVAYACLMLVYRSYKALPKALQLYERAKSFPPSPFLIDAVIGLAYESQAYAEVERIFNDTQAINPPPTLVNTTWLYVTQSFKEIGRQKPQLFRDFAKKYAGLLKRRAVLQKHSHLAAEIAALASTP